MATTRQNLRRNLSYLMGDFILDPSGPVPTCSAQGAADYSTAIDALLAYYDDDYFNEWFFVLPAGPTGSGTYEVTRVSDFTSSSGTMTLSPVASARIASAQPFELHRYSPAWKHLALNAARLQAIDVLHLPEADESLIVDNLLDNPSFETAVSGGTISGWTKKGTSTLSSETARRVHGTYSLKIIATGVAGVEQDLVNKLDMDQTVGKTLHVRAWVWDNATLGDQARIRVSFDGSTFTDGDYHAGDHEWEGPSVHQIDVVIPADASEVMVSCEVASDGTSYFDLVTAWVDKVNRYTLPTNFYRGPVKIDQQVHMSRPEGDYVPITRNSIPQSGRVLRIKGKRILSEVTAETGSMEISEPEDQILYAHALEWLADSNIGMASGAVREDLEADKQRWRVKAAELRSRASIKPPYQPIYAEQNGVWEIQWEGETGILLLKNR